MPESLAGRPDQAQTLIEQTRAQFVAVPSSAQFEHAIAVLVGKQPSDLSIAAAPLRRPCRRRTPEFPRRC